jgi:hypothetical protein
VQALVAGASLLAIFGVVIPSNPATKGLLHAMLLWGLLANAFIIVVDEMWMPHGTQDAAHPARLIVRGTYRQPFWSFVIGVGHVLPVLLLALIPGTAISVTFLAGLESTS